MKKLIIIFSLLGIGMISFGQTIEKWIDTDSLNSEKIVLNGVELNTATGPVIADTNFVNTRIYEIDTVEHAVNSDTALYVPFSVDLIDKTFYLSTFGSDITGDGTIENPYASYNRAIQDLKLNCSNITITFHIIIGSIEFTDDDKLNLLSRYFKNVQIVFEGEMVTVESGITVSETFTNSMVYNASKVALTVIENQYTGMFIDDGNERYLPIAFNTAGDGTFVLSSMRAGRNGIKTIVQNNCILDISSSYEDVLSFNVAGISKVSYEKIHIYNSTNDIDLQFNTVNTEFNFGTKITAKVIILGNNNDPSYRSMGFTGTFLNLSEIANNINTGNSRINLAIARSVIYAPNVISNNYALNLASNSFMRLREMAIVGGNEGSAINVSHNANVEISKTVLGVNLKAFMGFKFGTCNIFSVMSEGWSMLNLIGTEYLLYSDVSNTSYNENINIYINDFKKDGSYLDLIQYPAIHELIDWNKNIFINIPNYTRKIIFKQSEIDTIYSDTIPNKAYVDGNVKGTTGDLQLNNAGKIGVANNITTDYSIEFNEDEFIIKDVGYNRYWQWDYNTGNFLNIVDYGDGNDYYDLYIGRGYSYLEAYDASGDGGGFYINTGANGNSQLFVDNSTGYNSIEVNAIGAKIEDQSGSGSWTADYLMTKTYTDSYYSGSLTDGAPTILEINTATGLTPSTATANRKILILDTDGTGLYYDVISTGTTWVWFPGKTGTVAL